MRMDELKQGLWGYKKDSVYHYIASMEEKASERMGEKDAMIENLRAENKRQAEEQEKVIRTLQEENAALRRNQTAVFTAMQRTQQYADQLKADSERQQRAAQEKFSRFLQQKTQELDVYLGEIQQLRALVRKMLKDFDGKLGDAERTAAQLAMRAPRVSGEEEPLRYDRKTPQAPAGNPDGPNAAASAYHPMMPDMPAYPQSAPEAPAYEPVMPDMPARDLFGNNDRPNFSVLPGSGGANEMPVASGAGTVPPQENEDGGRSWKTISFT